MQAARLGHVAIANPIGSAILENPGLMPFLPGIARHFLGEELKLPSVATWWCGQERERTFVIDNLERLVIKPIHRTRGYRAIFGAQLTTAELAALRERILSKPHLYIGQEMVSFSTAPSLVDGWVEPRHAILRSFLVAGDDGYLAMPGGLTRIAPHEGELVVSNKSGGLSKDTWVLSKEPVGTSACGDSRSATRSCRFGPNRCRAGPPTTSSGPAATSSGPRGRPACCAPSSCCGASSAMPTVTC